MRHFLLVISILSMGTTSFGKMLFKSSYQWKYVDLLWESSQQKQEVINSGIYNASKVYLYDVDKASDGRVFVTAVSDKGVLVSVMTVTNKQGEGGPLLRPYPDWSWYKNNCSGFTEGVYQIDIKCNHLFVMDTGRIKNDRICLPQLSIFDLSTDKLVNRVTIPIEIARNKTNFGLLASCLVYVPDCRNVKNDAVVFMGDTKGFGLVVYNARTSKLSRIESDFMKATNFSFVSENLRYPAGLGIYGLTIIDKDLYYASMIGNKIHKIEYSKLIEFLEKDIDKVNQQTRLVGTLEELTTDLTSDRCAIFFNDITNTSVMCADATKEINSKNKELIAYDPKLLLYLSGMKVRHGDFMILSSRFLHHTTDSLNISEINYRVFSMPIEEIQKNTNCFSSCSY